MGPIFYICFRELSGKKNILAAILGNICLRILKQILDQKRRDFVLSTHFDRRNQRPQRREI